MNGTDSIQNASTPLYQQLLVLIPFLKVIEDSRRSGVSRMAPLRLNVTHRPSGKLAVVLSETHQPGDTPDNPEMTIEICSNTRNGSPLTYREAYVFSKTYLHDLGSAMSQSEQKTMFALFIKAWTSYVVKHQQKIKEMGLQ